MQLAEQSLPKLMVCVSYTTISLFFLISGCQFNEKEAENVQFSEENGKRIVNELEDDDNDIEIKE